MCVTITPQAARFIRRMVKFNQGSANAGFRLSARPGGCSGVDSSFTVEEQPHPGDTVIEQQGVRVFLTPESSNLLTGYTIDFRDGLASVGLSFDHPQQTACACSSASTKPGISVVTFMDRANNGSKARTDG
jgi:iron-sulfur cluster assembly protein